MHSLWSFFDVCEKLNWYSGEITISIHNFPEYIHDTDFVYENFDRERVSESIRLLTILLSIDKMKTMISLVSSCDLLSV